MKNEITITKDDFLEKSLQECINTNNNLRIDHYAKEVAYEVLDIGIEEHQFLSMNSDEKIQYFLNHTLMTLVSSKKWKKFIEESDFDINEIQNSLAIGLKRHYFLNTNLFPTN